MTEEQKDKIRKKIELIREKVKCIFELLDEIEKEVGLKQQAILEQPGDSTQEPKYPDQIDWKLNGQYHEIELHPEMGEHEEEQEEKKS